MVRNIPNDYARKHFVELLQSFGIQYNFVYVPIDWNKRANLGYAFVNLVDHAEALRLESCMSGFSNWIMPSEKVCEVVWGKPEQQDLDKIIERFRNSPVMHQDVPDEYKPLLLKNSRPVVFPAPTKKLQPPRGLKC